MLTLLNKTNMRNTVNVCAQHNRGMHGAMVLYVMLLILLIPSPRRIVWGLIHICTYFWSETRNWFLHAI